jgi:Domain of unknown function (DUF4272)
MPDKAPQPRPSPRDAARRLVVLKYVVVYALAAPPPDKYRKLLEKCSADDRRKFTADAEARREEFWQPLRQAGLWEYLSSSERELAGSTVVTMSPQQQFNATWRMEAAQVIVWALGLTPHLPPYDVHAQRDVLNEIPTEDIPRFVSSAQLREESEIDQARADAELWHWRSRTRQLVEEGREFPADEESRAAGFRSYDDVVRFIARKLTGETRMVACIEEDFPAKGKAYRKLSAQEWSEVRSVTVERHFALNWLCGYSLGNEWDHTPTET